MNVYLRLLILITGVITCSAQYCDNSKLRRCREEVGRQKERRIGELSRRDCRDFRENFDCLLDQTILCINDENERRQYGLDIESARRALKLDCDETEGWNNNRCYSRGEIDRCIQEIPRRILNADRDTCRKYDDFRECVDRVVNNQCSQEDRLFLRSFYMDIASDLPWRCARSSLTSPTRYPGTGYRPDDNIYGNRSRGSDQQCCERERCEDQDRYRDCRENLLKDMEQRNIHTANDGRYCSTLYNQFNCILWHTYNCRRSHEKDTNVLRSSKSHIENRCSVRSDLQRATCYRSTQMMDCERYLKEETSSTTDVTCREYASYFDCIQRQIRSCGYEDMFLQGFFLLEKVDEKAWTCSKREDSYSSYSPYDSQNTYPHDPYGSTTLGGDDQACEFRARREIRRCNDENRQLEDEASRAQNFRERHSKSCCSAYKFRDCIRRIVREQCQRERSNVVDSLLGSSMVSRLHGCQDVDQATCSASKMLNNAMLIFLAVAILRSIFQH